MCFKALRQTVVKTISKEKRGNTNVVIEEKSLSRVHPHGTTNICTLCHVMATSIIFSHASTLPANPDHTSTVHNIKLSSYTSLSIFYISWFYFYKCIRLFALLFHTVNIPHLLLSHPLTLCYIDRRTPEPVERRPQADVAHAAGVDVALLRSEVQVGREAEAEVAVGVVLSLADIALVHRLPVPGPGDPDFRRMEVADEADEGVGDPEFHLLLGVDQGGGAGCRRLTEEATVTLHGITSLLHYVILFFFLHLLLRP